jgi:hypothetical protein
VLLANGFSAAEIEALVVEGAVSRGA